MYVRFATSIAIVLAVAGCAGRTSNSPLPLALPPPHAQDGVTIARAEVPAAYRCLPSGFPASDSTRPALAYATHCAVAGAPEKGRLQELAVAMMASHNGTHVEYCTGTPLAYDPSTKVGFVVTAAHCVLGGSKAAGANVTPANIAIFRSAYWVYQGTRASKIAFADLTAQIRAAYVPTRYCEGVPFSGGGCIDPAKQNGDVAVVKITSLNGRDLRVNPDLRLAPTALHVPADAEIMALGYGYNTSPTPDDRVLNYVTYRYFATNSYAGVNGTLSIMNGYHHNGTYYAILCQGDSGGGDFTWDGGHWNLFGIHSFGSAPCGTRSTAYKGAIAASADARPWEAWIQLILNSDHAPTGCANLNQEQYVCRS